METTDKFEIARSRSYKVVKSNEIIQKARYDLPLVEIKAFSFILSKIKPTDQAGQKYTFTLNEYCRVLGIETNNGKNIQTIKQSLQNLRSKTFWVMLENGDETTVGWLDKAWINHGSGKITVRLDETIQNYVIGLFDGKFTQYELLCTLPMRSSYSIRIYELLKSYANLKKHTFDVEELKNMLGCTHYVRFPDFRRKVLDVSTKEINRYTDLSVSWEPVTKGRKVVAISYSIKQLDSWGRFENMDRTSKQLDGQMSIDDFIKD